MFDKVIIIGVGQIGASMGLNLIRLRLAREVIGIGRTTKNLREAVCRRAIHRVGKITELSGLTRNDLVILATPVRTVVHFFKRLGKEPLVIDVGSTKGAIVREACRRRLRFVGCHPIAGTEKAGATAGDRHLFRGNLCILTPRSSHRGLTSDEKKVGSLWKRLGAKVVVMKAERHDRLFAAVSHLPHVMAFSLVTALDRLVDLPADKPFIFNSLKGTTRIAASPAEMWQDIFIENRKNILRGLDYFSKEVKRLTGFIMRGKSRSLLKYLENARMIRESFPL